MNWEEFSASDLVIAALLAATNLRAYGFAAEFKKILQTPKANWFGPDTPEAALETRALDGPQEDAK